MKEKIKILLFFIFSAICGYVCGHFAADNQLLGIAMCILFIFIIMFGYAICMKIYTLEDFPFCGNKLEVEPEEITEEDENTQANEQYRLINYDNTYTYISFDNSNNSSDNIYDMFWHRRIVNCNSYNRNTYYCWIINKMDYRFDKKEKSH